MSLIDTLNSLIVGAINKRREKVVFDGETLGPKGCGHAICMARGGVAYEYDRFGGTGIALTLLFEDDAMETVTQEDDCWHALLDALEQQGRLEPPPTEWMSRLLAGETREVRLELTVSNYTNTRSGP